MEVHMKKIKIISLILTMVLILTACGSSDKKGNNEKATSNKADVTDNGQADKNVSNDNSENTENKDLSSDETQGAEDKNSDNGNGNKKVLVAYFSVTHTTENIAKEIANIAGADLYEIVPEQPYTDEDIDYNDDNSRCTVENNDSSARPAISGKIDNLDQYDIVFIGYPIWWGKAPKIMNTFVESYNFEGKIIVPFCTSASSGIGSSADNLVKSTDGATWKDGQRFSSNATMDDIASWINDLEIGILK